MDLLDQEKNANLSSEDGEGRDADALSLLRGYPHIVCNIFSVMNPTALLTAERVSPIWKQIISAPNIWKKNWKRNERISTIWRILSARLEKTNPEMFDRMKSGDVSAYRKAYVQVQRNIQQIEEYKERKRDVWEIADLPNSDYGRFISHFLKFQTDERHVYIIGSVAPAISSFNPTGQAVIILDRWTRNYVNSVVISGPGIKELQVNDRFLVIQQLSTGTIAVYRKADFQLIQTVHDQIDIFNSPNSDCHIGMCLGSDFLANMTLSRSHRLVVINVRRWNPSTNMFGPDVHRRIEWNIGPKSGVSPKIYCDEKVLIFEYFTRDWSRRIIIAFDIKSFKEIRHRVFNNAPEDSAQFTWWRPQAQKIKREIHNGRIVVFDRSGDGQFFLATWDVLTSSIQPICNLYSALRQPYSIYSATMSYNPNYQCVLVWDKPFGPGTLMLFPIDGSKCGGDPIIITDSSDCPIKFSILGLEQNFFFDGAQCIYNDYSSNYLNFIELVS